MDIAYFSIEIGLREDIPTYSGGLGILAGDHIRSAADLGLPLCGVTLLYREGYFQQRLAKDGSQIEQYPPFDPQSTMRLLPTRVMVRLRERDVHIQAWQYDVAGNSTSIPVFFLDTNLPENHEDDRRITSRLYYGGPECRLMQEAVLGFGGVRLIDELGYSDIKTYHLNEGHTAFLTIELLNRFGNADTVRDHCLFTTHTPVPAGHDVFEPELVNGIIGELIPDQAEVFDETGILHMTKLALRFSRNTNAVSRLHQQVTRKMFPEYDICYVNNGVHHLNWTTEHTKKIFDKHLPGWRDTPDLLNKGDTLPNKALLEIHRANKEHVLSWVRDETGQDFSPDILTIGFARRATGYKRAHLIFADPERLEKICNGRIQIVYAGKAHPRDETGKQLIKEVVKASNRLGKRIRIAYLEDYNIELGRILTSGVDVWLNTPRLYNEASGTSGMKAALNGVPNLSILDGWWAEACKHGVNGWAVGDPDHTEDAEDAQHLYRLLEKDVLPAYYQDTNLWVSLMKHAIITAADFTSHRMVTKYDQEFYRKNAG